MDADRNVVRNRWGESARLAAVIAAVRGRPVFAVAVLGVVLRLLAIPVTLLEFNPYAGADTDRFARFARWIGTSYLSGPLVPGPLLEPSDGVAIHRLWGLILSPFYALPGPSQIYVLLVMVVIGGAVIYNVGAIGRRLHSPAAGALAALPVAALPSFVLVHTTILRESLVLLGITLAARVLIAPPQWLSTGRRIGVAAGALAGVTLLRPENLPLYLAVLAIGTTVWYWQTHEVSRRVQAGAGIATTGVLAAGVWFAPRVVDALARLNVKRTEGRTAYLTGVVADSVPAAIAVAPLGAVYFLFAPLPWMVHGLSDLIVFAEALVNLAFAAAAIGGVRYAYRRSPAAIVALVAGLLLASGLYGLVEGNVGTAVRHRQMFVWVLYAIGAVGIVEWRRPDQVL